MHIYIDIYIYACKACDTLGYTYDQDQIVISYFLNIRWDALDHNP